MAYREGLTVLLTPRSNRSCKFCTRGARLSTSSMSSFQILHAMLTSSAHPAMHRKHQPTGGFFGTYSSAVHMTPTGSDAEGRGSTRGPRNGGGGGSCSHALHHTHAYVHTFDARALTRQSFTGRWHLADPRAAGCMAMMRAYAGMAAARTRGAFKQHACSLVGTMRNVALANGQPWTGGVPCRRLVATFRLVALARKASLVVTPMWSRKYGSLCVHIST